MEPVSDREKIGLHELHFAPLQGFTDRAYIKAFDACYGSVDFFYTPYFSTDDKLLDKDLIYPDNLIKKIVPQILPANIDELKVLSRFIERNGFPVINLNLGCPYPMVTRRGRGASLIQKPDLVAEMVDYINDCTGLEVSIKSRLGMNDESEIIKMLDVLTGKKIKTFIIHPRLASQLYKGEVSKLMFKKCREQFPMIDFIYNGDIVDMDFFDELTGFIPDQRRWMIGRGLLSDPYLSEQIKGKTGKSEKQRVALLEEFVSRLMEEIINDSNDSGHALNRMKAQFFYLSNAFSSPIRVYRFAKKAKKMSDFEDFIYLEIREMYRSSV